MLKSMTAYGCAEKKSAKGTITAEIQSLNRKFFDLTVMLPKEFFSLDIFVRGRISTLLKRGKIHVKITAAYNEETPISVNLNLPLVREIKEAWETMEKDLRIASEIDLKVIAQMPDVLRFDVKKDSEEEWKTVIFDAVDQALEQMQKMRAIEGKAIYDDFAMRISRLEELMQKVKTCAPEIKEKSRSRLCQTLSEVLKQSEELQDRLFKEACLYAEKGDIEEEVIRFFSHLEQFKLKMDASNEPVGKTLEFLLQEMQREANTIGAKAQDLQVSHIVVEIKGEIERIREQVQNVE